MSLKGNFIISNIQKKQVSKISSHFRMANNAIRVVKRTRNELFFQEVKESLGNYRDIKTTNPDLYQEYINMPNFSLKYNDNSEIFSGDFVKMFNMLKLRRGIESFPQLYGQVIFYDGHIKNSKEYLYDMWRNLASKYNCRIYFELEKKKPKKYEIIDITSSNFLKTLVEEEDLILPNFYDNMTLQNKNMR